MSNDAFQTWFDDCCEVGKDFKAGKQEVTQSSGKELRAVKDELMRLGFKYNRDLRVNGQKGVWKGFRVKLEDEIDMSDHDTDAESDDELETEPN